MNKSANTGARQLPIPNPDVCSYTLLSYVNTDFTAHSHIVVSSDLSKSKSRSPSSRYRLTATSIDSLTGTLVYKDSMSRLTKRPVVELASKAKIIDFVCVLLSTWLGMSSVYLRNSWAKNLARK